MRSQRLRVTGVTGVVLPIFCRSPMCIKRNVICHIIYTSDRVVFIGPFKENWRTLKSYCSVVRKYNIKELTL